jgi:hypothetical protein
MAIGTNALIDFFGTQDQVDDTATAAIASAAFSADQASWTNDDDAPFGVMVFRCQWATAPTDGSLINIYARKMDVQSTSDSPIPTAINTDQYIGSFVVDGDVAINTNVFLVTNWLSLPNHQTSQIYNFYFQNSTGQQITSGWAAWITPCTRGPHP